MQAEVIREWRRRCSLELAVKQVELPLLDQMGFFKDSLDSSALLEVCIGRFGGVLGTAD